MKFILYYLLFVSIVFADNCKVSNIDPNFSDCSDPWLTQIQKDASEACKMTSNSDDFVNDLFNSLNEIFSIAAGQVSENASLYVCAGDTNQIGCTSLAFDVGPYWCAVWQGASPCSNSNVVKLFH